MLDNLGTVDFLYYNIDILNLGFGDGRFHLLCRLGSHADLNVAVRFVPARASFLAQGFLLFWFHVV